MSTTTFLRKGNKMNLKEIKEIKHRLYKKEYWNEPEETECSNIPLTMCGYLALQETDSFLVGTQYYMGLAWFWHRDYRHYLRDRTPNQLKKIHDLFIKNEIPLLENDIRKTKYFDFTKKGERICQKYIGYFDKGEK